MTAACKRAAWDVLDAWIDWAAWDALVAWVAVAVWAGVSIGDHLGEHPGFTTANVEALLAPWIEVFGDPR